MKSKADYLWIGSLACALLLLLGFTYFLWDIYRTTR